MKPTKFEAFMNAHGKLETHASGRVFHTQDFDKKLFLLKSGYVKRYQARELEQKVLELIYGPGHIISLSQLYKMVFGIDQNQEGFLYVYQAMTDVEILGIEAQAVIKELETDPEMYKDFFYESGLKLRSNISRLASNSLKDPEKKVAHQLAGLAYEFGDARPNSDSNQIELPFPHTAKDLAEQLNIPEKAAEAALQDLIDKKIIRVDGPAITIIDMRYLHEAFSSPVR